jgi:predicted metal-dependent TIM-barrel fold hydrolase
MVEIYGAQRIWLNCACDWGHSDPLAVPKTALEMKRRGHSEIAIDRLIYKNPREFLGQNPKFRLDEIDWEDQDDAPQK